MDETRPARILGRMRRGQLVDSSSRVFDELDEVGSSIVLVDSWTDETRSARRFFFSGLG
ncbi:hypothetical protein F2Q69_00055764 [Brassica cretica]|uniref:Uncharacterized protein n=1 Tax=Brassica cretica TaxID=69181 RepID=A0A8S9N7H7_BRACR|nr:hypothetical protein F2Q69_00055764 [Brassica cretica]